MALLTILTSILILLLGSFQSKGYINLIGGSFPNRRLKVSSVNEDVETTGVSTYKRSSLSGVTLFDAYLSAVALALDSHNRQAAGGLTYDPPLK